MNQIKKLENYCKKMLLEFEINDETLTVGGEDYRIITDDGATLFDADGDFVPIFNTEADEIGYVYEFCGRWYLQNEGEEVSMEELKYKGKAVQKLPMTSFLGVRSGYELMNGIGLYKDWVKKAKFLGVEALGVCEKGTLSGALEFQTACQKEGIKSIIGMSIPIKLNEEICEIKLYVQNFQGWLSLLKFNTKINVDKELFLTQDFVVENSNCLYIVADPKTMPFDGIGKELFNIIDFYQLDTAYFLNEDKDADYINNLEKYILSPLQPISICDAFYLEQDDYLTREALWMVDKSFDDKTNNQYFKNRDQYAKELISMFDSSANGWRELFKIATENEKGLAGACNFKYDTDTRHLPKYVMTEEEAAQFETNDDLFIHLVKKGFKNKGFAKPDIYVERLKKEIDVLKAGDVIDYFLGLYDIIRYSREQGFLIGIGRGSAGGSLVAYLLDIIQIDPLEFDLLFERFLNSGRMGEYQDRPSYTIELEDGSTLELAEGSLVRVKRAGTETAVFIHELKEGDELLRY